MARKKIVDDGLKHFLLRDYKRLKTISQKSPNSSIWLDPIVPKLREKSLYFLLSKK